MAAIYSNGGNRWNILGFNFTKRDALSNLYKISMQQTCYRPEIQQFVNKLWVTTL
jgi:hypothetical protein